MLERYKNNKSHFTTRGCIVLGIVLLFVVHSILFIDRFRRSCLGDPRFLFFVFLGLPIYKSCCCRLNCISFLKSVYTAKTPNKLCDSNDNYNFTNF